MEGNSIDVGVIVHQCSKCDKYNEALKIYDMFAWNSVNKIIGYDKESNTITISEEGLMKIIQMVNPA